MVHGRLLVFVFIVRKKTFLVRKNDFFLYKTAKVNEWSGKIMMALWESFYTWIQRFGLPAVAVYHLLCTSVFLNVSAVDATGLEKVANVCLIPVQYVLAGQ